MNSLCFLTFYSVFLSVNSFNLEVRLPVIKRGHAESFFGFSVAEHQTVNDLGEVDQSWLLVGAPLDNNKQPQTNRSGALWSCPISTRQDDCIQVTTDGKRNVEDGLYDPSVDDNELKPPLDDEVKDGQWMGVTVRSQGTGGKVMVCAHRYIRSGEDFRFGGGLCYTLTQRLDYDESWEPCKGRPTNRAHEQFGYCQAGTSGMLVNDTALIGTPGPYTWKGTVFVISVSADYLSRDKTMYYSPLTEDKAPIDHYSYLGMSVAGGELLGKEMYIAAGAPRSDGTGQVVIFKKQPSITIMDVVKVLSGEQFTSNFGYEMTVADINGDKLADLLVGAPNYFSKDSGGAVYIYLNKNYCLDCAPPEKITGKLESRFGIAIANLGDLNKDGYEDIAVGAPYEDKGVVYIYLGSKDGLIKEPSQVIKGRHIGSDLLTFGYSLSGGLDVDFNGYPDLLIGAFEGAAVTLLRARPIVNLSTKVGPPANLSNIDPKRPGCALHRNSNLTCFSFEACVTVKALVGRGSSSGEYESPSVMKVLYRLEADVNRKFSRVSFDTYGVRQNVLEKEISMNRDSINGEFKHCHSHIAYIKEGTRDIQSAVGFRLMYYLVQDEPRLPSPGAPLPSVDNFPILNQQQAAKLFSATFLKDCGDNDICESQLVIEATLNLPKPTGFASEREYELVLGELDELRLDATVTNLQESAYETSLLIHHPPSLQYIGFVKQIEAGHSCEVVNATLILCSVGNPLPRNGSSQITVRFDSEGLDDTASSLDVIVIANTTSKLIDAQSPLALTATVVKKAELTLTGNGRPEQVIYGGQVRGESSMRYKDDIGSRVTHTYQVFNSGPWRVRNLQVEIEWPHQVANNKPLGKWLLYMDEKPVVETLGGGECIIPPTLVNPLRLPNRVTAESLREPPTDEFSFENDNMNSYREGFIGARTKRDTEFIVKSTNYTDPSTGRTMPIVKLSCNLETAKCFKFKCTIYSLEKNQEATIFIKSRLWNVTLVEDYSHVSRVWISSRARLILPPEFNIQQDTSDDMATVKVVALRGKGEAAADELPLWIIIVSVVAGLIILLFLVVLLSKCGFFRRRRPQDPTLSADAILDKTKHDDYDY